VGGFLKDGELKRNEALRCPYEPFAASEAVSRSLPSIRFRTTVARFFAVATLVLARHAAGAVEDRAAVRESGSPDLPDDVAPVVERSTSCAHFAGEFSGDRSARDTQINRVMAELRCDTVDADVAELRRKYAGNRRVQEALAAEPEP
jgi:hypothetical protein